MCVVRSQGDPHFQVDRSEDTRQQRQRRLTCTGLNPGDGRLGDPGHIGKLALRHAALKARQSQHVAGEAVDWSRLALDLGVFEEWPSARLGPAFTDALLAAVASCTRTAGALQ